MGVSLRNRFVKEARGLARTGFRTRTGSPVDERNLPKKRRLEGAFPGFQMT